MQANISVYVPYGDNDHHKIESLFKALGRALKMAIEIKEELRGEVLSTKGLLDDSISTVI